MWKSIGIYSCNFDEAPISWNIPSFANIILDLAIYLKCLWIKNWYG